MRLAGISWPFSPPVFQKQTPQLQAPVFVRPADSVLFSGKPLKDKVEKHYPVIVIGGGMAGLMAMYDLVKRNGVKAVLLESDRRLGGNSRSGKSPEGVSHPAGSSILLPGGKQWDPFWQELKIPLDKGYKLKPEIYVTDAGERFVAFGTDEERAEFPPPKHWEKVTEKFREMLHDLKEIYEGEDGPVLPIHNATKKAMKKWDGMTMAGFLAPYGKKVRYLVEKYMESDLAAPSNKLAAYIGMADIDDLNNRRFVLPGGNGFIIKRLKDEVEAHSKFMNETPFQLENVVEWVEQDNEKAYVQYRDLQGKLHVISADHVLMGVPYNKIPNKMDLPRKVVKLMKSIPRSSYAIVNIYLKKTPLKTHQFYMTPDSKYIADLVVTTEKPSADKPDPNEPSVMTIYTPHYGRVKSKEAYGKTILNEIKRYFPEVTDDIVSGVSVNPFHQSMIAPKINQVEKLRSLPRTYGKVTIINGDGGGVPCTQSTIDEALRGTKTVLKQLRNLGDDEE